MMKQRQEHKTLSYATDTDRYRENLKRTFHNLPIHLTGRAKKWPVKKHN